MAERLGVPLMPHQRAVLDTALEVGPDGHLVYRTCVFSIPRQSGKSTVCRVLTTWWGLTQPSNNILVTAQTGFDARSRWAEHVDDLATRPFFKRQFARTPRRGNGTELLVWRSGTRYRPVPPVARKSHGEVLDLAILDECWALDESVVTAMRPAMMTRPSAQLWLTSTAGTEESLLWLRHLEMGRRAVKAGETEGICFFEWAADPDDDPDDEEVWKRVIPTIGRTVTLERLRADKATLTAESWERSYLNRHSAGALATAIPWGAWLLANELDVAAHDPIWVCPDIAPERDRASLVIAGPNADGSRVVVELVTAREGVEWLPAAIDRLRGERDVLGVVVDGTGPAATLEQDMAEGEPPELLKHREMVLASQAFLDAVVDQRLVIRSDPYLTAAMRAATQMGSGDSWRWSRKRSKGDISPLVGATVAWWKARQTLGTPTLRVF